MSVTWREWDLRVAAQSMASGFAYSRQDSVRLNSGSLPGGDRVATFVGTTITVDTGAMESAYKRLSGVSTYDFAYVVVADEVAGMTLRDDGSVSSYNLSPFEAAVNLLALAALGIEYGPLFDSGLARARASDWNATENALQSALTSGNSRLVAIGQRAQRYFQLARAG